MTIGEFASGLCSVRTLTRTRLLFDNTGLHTACRPSCHWPESQPIVAHPRAADCSNDYYWLCLEVVDIITALPTTVLTQVQD